MKQILLCFFVSFVNYFDAIIINNETGNDIVIFANYIRNTQNTYEPHEFNSVEYIIRASESLMDLTIIHVEGWRIFSVIASSMDDCISLPVYGRSIKELRELVCTVKQDNTQLVY